MFSLLVILFIIELYAQMDKLPRCTTFYSFSLSLTSCIFSSTIISDDHYISYSSYFLWVSNCRILHTQLPYATSYWKWGDNRPENRGKFSRKPRAKVSKIYSFLNFLFWWYSDWKMSLYKPGQVRAYFFQWQTN